jgi:hypothetical protein
MDEKAVQEALSRYPNIYGNTLTEKLVNALTGLLIHVEGSFKEEDSDKLLTAFLSNSQLKSVMNSIKMQLSRPPKRVPTPKVTTHAPIPPTPVVKARLETPADSKKSVKEVTEIDASSIVADFSSIDGVGLSDNDLDVLRTLYP